MISPPRDFEHRRLLRASAIPSTFEPDYVENAVRPYLASRTYLGATPLLPMLDLALSKHAAIPPHVFGMGYESWQPTFDDGLTVFFQAYEDRGPSNARKRIYYSALTPDLYASKYSKKVVRFLNAVFAESNSGKPLMREYYDRYFELYWDLHLGVRGRNIPAYARQIGESFNAALGFWDPTLQTVHDNYMRVRALREDLKQWIDRRVQAILDGEVADAESTFAYYWLKNGKRGADFRRKDIVFECFHNFVAFSQWGNTLYNIMARLEKTRGMVSVRAWFERTMEAPEETDGTAFSRLDRFVMELFRTNSPNGGSLSTVDSAWGDSAHSRSPGTMILTPHPEANRNPMRWSNPNQFDPDRYRAALTTERNDEVRSKQLGLAKCPFKRESFALKDGRGAELLNSIFGTVYGLVDGRAYDICDDAGYAPFGFGYRRCPGELVTVGFVKDLLRKVWSEKIRFERLRLNHPEQLAVGPATVILDNLAFRRSA